MSDRAPLTVAFVALLTLSACVDAAPGDNIRADLECVAKLLGYDEIPAEVPTLTTMTPAEIRAVGRRLYEQGHRHISPHHTLAMHLRSIAGYEIILPHGWRESMVQTDWYWHELGHHVDHVVLGGLEYATMSVHDRERRARWAEKKAGAWCE